MMHKPSIIDRRTAQALAGDGFGSSRPGQPSISCVVPCHNEAANLPQLLERLKVVLSRCATHWEVVLVDDGSTDQTPAVCARWTRLPGFRALQLSRNFGKEAALTAGLQASRGDVVVTLDADLQHAPELIPLFLDQWRGGADVAYAVRENRTGEGAVKRWGARLFYALINATDRFELPAGAGDFRLMDRRVVDALLALPERNRFMKGLYAWVGFKAAAVPYLPEQRGGGKSHFRARALLGLSLVGLTAFTTWPLRAVSVVGYAIAALSFGYGGWLSLMYLLYGHEVSGWTTIVVSLLFLAGIQLISLGVVGEYVGRVFEEVKARPLYLVRQEMGRGLKARRP